MKISPMPAGQGGMSSPGTNLKVDSHGTRAVPTPVVNVSPEEVEARSLLNPRRIKMNVNRTPGPREYQAPPPEEADVPATDITPSAPAEGSAPAVSADATNSGAAVPADSPADGTAPTPAPEAERPLSSTSEQANESAEETKPLSPQFAALARQRRALQVKERELATREDAIKARESSQSSPTDFMASLKAEPLRLLREAGVSYDDLYQHIVSGKEPDPEVIQLKKELKDMKENLEKTFADRDSQAEKQALGEMRKEAESLAYSSDDFELVRETKAIPKVMALIERAWREEQEILPVQEALRLVEEDLLNQTLRTAALKKIQGRLAPKPPPAPPAPEAPKPVMKTLTNRDTSPAPALSRKERAIRAALGQK